MESVKNEFAAFVKELQDEICEAVEIADGKARFQTDTWEREGGGGGESRVISKGDVFEKGGVNVSEVFGELPELIRKRFEVEQGWFYATGVSLILHPWSPMIPTVHANYRYFELYEDESQQQPVDLWFGGGVDLTPYYLWEEDARHFHEKLKEACDPFSPKLYPDFKRQCDEYFYNEHREEARGVGGIFYDYCRPNGEMSVEDWFKFSKSVGKAFLPSYLPIVDKRREEPYGEQERYFQEIRRGRYVEFNLIHDRGTLFGLKTKGRTESILMSLPPRVRWDYQYEVEEGSREEKLLAVLKEPREWVGE